MNVKSHHECRDDIERPVEGRRRVVRGHPVGDAGRSQELNHLAVEPLTLQVNAQDLVAHLTANGQEIASAASDINNPFGPTIIEQPERYVPKRRLLQPDIEVQVLRRAVRWERVPVRAETLPELVLVQTRN